MRVVLLGAGGMLGRDLVATTPQGVSLFPATRAQLDITDDVAVAARVAEVRPDLIINAAAYTAVDRAESEPQLAFEVNGRASGELGKIAARARIRVVHFSTDYVFDGTAKEPYVEDASTNPINVYGASKLAGERALRESGAQHLLIRTQWLFGLHGDSFPRTMLERVAQGIPTAVVSDQTGKPTYTVDLAISTWRLIEARVEGVIHVANSGWATWYEVGRHVFTLAGKPDLITSCTSSEYPTTASRPSYTVLSTAKAEAALGHGMPDWRLALERFIRSV
jgi:dTDP-4-dehydrorhamnose reductase